jgi:hypothetical protein
VIEFNTTPLFRKLAPISLVEAIKDIEYTLNSLRADIDLLPIVQFDPRYTKPVNLTSVDIVGKALEETIVVTLDTYTQSIFSYRNPFIGPVNAHVKTHQPNRIYFNTRMFSWNRNKDEWKDTTFHELIHIWDAHSPFTFDHGDNKLKGKDETANVKLAKLLTNLSYSLRSAPVEPLIW